MAFGVSLLLALLVGGECALLAPSPRVVPHATALPLRPARHPIACAEGGDEGEPASDFQVVLRDVESNRTLECQILETTEISGRLYASMTPVDTPVAITEIGDGMMLEVEDEELLEALLPTAEAVTSEMGLTLHNTAVTLTVSGELAEGDKFDESTLDLDDIPEASAADMTDMEQLEGVEEEEDEDDGAEVLLSFRHEKQTYYIVRLLEPVFVVGRQEELTGFVLPDEDEMVRVGPILEDMMTRNAVLLQEPPS